MNLPFDEFWKDDKKSELIHFIGKDILYFHALFWPATLEFSNFRKPTKIFAHGFLTVNGEKMSKSRGTFITARSYLDSIKNTDFLRYYYSSKLNDSMEDIDLNFDDFVSKVNSDLVGKLINIPSRTSGFVVKYFKNKLVSKKAFLDKDYINLLNEINNIKEEVNSLYEKRLFSKLVKLLMSHVEKLNEFISAKEPWILAKDESQHVENSELHHICSLCLHTFRAITIYITPITPDLSSKISVFFNEQPYELFDDLQSESLVINKYEHLMKRLDLSDIDEMLKNK